MSDIKFKREILFLAGCLFFILFWIFGYDGITFSDDVLYLVYGRDFWQGVPLNNDIHFTDRWGAYLFSGFFTWLFGFSDRVGSLVSLIAYLISYILLFQLNKEFNYKFWFTLFFCSHVYFLHFLPKVYPDSLLVLWIILVPCSAVYRNKYPAVMAFLMAAALMIGFSTKETMVLLLPFPILLFILDWKRSKPLRFYYWFGFWSFLLLLLFFASYQLKHGNLFYRFSSINAGHYISEFTYHDKGLWSVLKRVTYLPLLIFVERSYWLWLVFSIPGIYYGLKDKAPVKLEFALAAICLLIGFWFMSSTLNFYNPIYLNPRHLVILIGPLSVLVAMGLPFLTVEIKWKTMLTSLLGLGVLLAMIQVDFKMAAYLLAVTLLFFYWSKKSFFKWIMLLLLLIPVVASVFYQKQIKNYSYFTDAFKHVILTNENEDVILVNSFVYFSQHVLIPDVVQEKNYLLDLEQWNNLEEIKNERFQLLLYKYYLHAYPQEQVDLDVFNAWLEKSDYTMISEKEDAWLIHRTYERK